MMTITATASKQILHSAKESGINNAILRVAIKRNADDSLHYAVGFDDAISKTDIKFESEGIQLVTDNASMALGNGMTIDFVKLDNGETNFIFINPNDKNYTPPTDN